MNIVDSLLDKFGIKVDEKLSIAEREQLEVWLQAAEQQQLTIPRIRDGIAAMRHSVEEELTKPRLGKEEDLFLKARLRNYMLLESFLMAPERARKALETALANLKPRG